MAYLKIPGLVMVPMALKPGLSVQECDDWYNNEHVPMRMKLPYFQTGGRYRSIEDNEEMKTASGLEEWLALYDISDMNRLLDRRYERLLEAPAQSARESEVLQQIKAVRFYYDLVATYKSPEYISDQTHCRKDNVEELYRSKTIVVGVRLMDSSADAESEWNRWYDEDHMPAVRQIPGWRRTKRYRRSVIEEDSTAPSYPAEFLTLNEFGKDAAISGREHRLAMQTEVKTSVVASKWRHMFKLHHLQGKAARDLDALRRQGVKSFTSPDGLTHTGSNSASQPYIENYFTTTDDMIVPYRLEGGPDNHGPTVVLYTSMPLSWDLWDGSSSVLLRALQGKCRILRLSLPVRLDDIYTRHGMEGENATSKDLITGFEALHLSTPILAIGLKLAGPSSDGPRNPVKIHTCDGDGDVISRKWATITCPTIPELKHLVESVCSPSTQLSTLEEVIDSIWHTCTTQS